MYNLNLHDVDVKLLNYESPIKRNFINKCIDNIYNMKGKEIPTIHVPFQHNRQVIWSLVDDLMKPTAPKKRPLLLEKIKRRLFPDCKKTSRKSKNPKRSKSNFSEVKYFKPSRYYLNLKKAPRNDLNYTEQHMHKDLSQKLKRKLSDLENGSEKQANLSDINAAEPPFGEQDAKRIRYYEVCRVSRRAQKFEEILGKRYRRLAAANDKYLEATVRSVLYVKTLMGIITEQQVNGNN